MNPVDVFIFTNLLIPVVANNITNLSLNSNHRIRVPKWTIYKDNNRSSIEEGTESSKITTNLFSFACPDGLERIGEIAGCGDYEDICYAVKMVGFPYECDYFDYFQIHEDVLPIPIESLRFLVKRNSLYGYYEITQPGTLFRKLMPALVEQVEEWHSCVVGLQVPSAGCSFGYYTFLRDCEATTADSLCFYNGSNYNFCENFRQICGTGCKCARYNNKFLCETEEDCEEPCTECIEKFDAYPLPTIDLRKQNELIYVIVRNSLKIAEKNGVELHCFAENSYDTHEMVWDKQELNELFRVGNDTIIYTMEYQHGGLYWCEYFSYPHMELVKSKEVVFEHEGVHSFILNILISADDFVFAPYNVVTETRRILSMIYGQLYYGVEIFIVRLHPIHYDFANLTLRINTYPFIDASVVIENLRGVLANYMEPTIMILSFFLSPADRCLTASYPEKNLTFPTARVGEIAVAEPLILNENGLPLRRRCLGSYLSGVFWEDLSETLISGNPSPITNDLQSLQSLNASAEEFNEILFEIIKDADYVIPYDVYLISQILHRIVSSNKPFDEKIFTSNINVVMRFPFDVLSSAQQELNATDIILYSYDLVLGTIANRKKFFRPFIIETDLILSQVANIQRSPVNGMAVYKNGTKFQIESLTGIKSFDEINHDNLIFATYLPEHLYDALKASYTHENDMHLVTALYLNNALFNPKNSDLDAGYIVSLFVPNFDAFILNVTIPTYFGIVGINRTCAFWRYGFDDQLISIFGSWEYQNDSIDLKTYKICNFDHMTHFALLVNAPTSDALRTFNRIASIASIIGSIVIIITAVTFSKWREQAGTIVLLNYTATVFVQHILLLLFDLFPNADGIFCKGIGIVIHYIILVQFSWMLVISYMQYLKLVVVFGQQPVNIILKSSISSWFLPIIPVGIVAGISIDSYNCFLTGYPFYLGLVIPISMVILVNLITFIRILLSLFCTNVNIPTKQKEYYKVSVSIILFFLMGFTWVFGLLANFLGSLAFSYIFCALTAFQGIIICVYFVVLQKHTRKMWLKKACGWFGKNDNNVSSFSTSKVS